MWILDIIESSPHLKAILSRSYILGGSPCSGKSTLAEQLSACYDLHYYKVDDHYEEHISRCNPQQQPTMSKIAQMDWNQIWSRPAALLVQEEIGLLHNRYQLYRLRVSRIGHQHHLLHYSVFRLV